MSTQRIMQLLVFGIILLIGLTLLQYIHLKQQAVSAEAFKAEILAELRGGDFGSVPVQAKKPQEGLDQGSNSEHRPVEPVEPEPPPEPLSQNQYWISTDYSDDKPYGFSGWLELVPGGHFILEQCFAPDYSVAVSAEQDPYQPPTCKVLADTHITRVSGAELVLEGNQTVPIDLDAAARIQTLSLILGDNTIELVPGQKNTLWEGLAFLPSVKTAHDAAWKKHNELRGEL